jgi:hypothetical protein
MNKGPDWTPAQWIAASVGFFSSAALAGILGREGYLTKGWGTVLIGAGLCIPPAIIRWREARKRSRG